MRGAVWKYRWVLIALALTLGTGGCPDDGDDDSGGEADDDTSSGDAPIADVQWQRHDEIESILVVSWTQLAPATGHVEYGFDEGEWRSTPSSDLDAGARQALLLGIPYETDVTFRVVNDLGEGPVASADVEAQTGSLPGDLPVPELLVGLSDQWEPTGSYLLGSINAYQGGWTGGDYWKFILDRQGRVVWALLTPENHWTIYSRVSLDGRHILWDEFSYWSHWDEGANSQVHYTKIDGSITRTVPTPGGHHAFTELPDGSLVWGAASWWSETLEKRDPLGIQSTIWDCWEFEDAHGGSGYCQSNSLYYHEPTDSFLYSFYTSDTVVEIDGATGATVRIFGHTPDSYLFEPTDAAFWWQHGATYTDAGTLLLSTYVDSQSSELVAREYELDDEAEVLGQVWSFGAGEGVHGDTAGEAHRLPGGNTLHNYGDGCRVREIAPDGTVVWDADWEGSRLLGRTVFLEDLYDFAP